MISWGHVDPTQLDPAFRKDVEDFLGPSPYGWEVRYGYRSLVEQADLFAKYQKGGPRAAPAGRSAHNFGRAVDVVLDGAPAPGIQPDWNTAHPGWVWLRNEVVKHPRLRTGASYADYGHIEAVDWKRAA